MVRDTQSRLIRDLGARFTKANLVRDEKGSKATVAKVARYIAAPFRPFYLLGGALLAAGALGFVIPPPAGGEVAGFAAAAALWAAAATAIVRDRRAKSA